MDKIVAVLMAVMLATNLAADEPKLDKYVIDSFEKVSGWSTIGGGKIWSNDVLVKEGEKSLKWTANIVKARNLICGIEKTGLKLPLPEKVTLKVYSNTPFLFISLSDSHGNRVSRSPVYGLKAREWSVIELAPKTMTAVGREGKPLVDLDGIFIGTEDGAGEYPTTGRYDYYVDDLVAMYPAGTAPGTPLYPSAAQLDEKLSLAKEKLAKIDELMTKAQSEKLDVSYQRVSRTVIDQFIGFAASAPDGDLARFDRSKMPIQAITYDATNKNVIGAYKVTSSTLGGFKCGPSDGTVVCGALGATFTGEPVGNVALDGTNLYYLDGNTGAIYRTVALAALRSGIALDDDEALARLLPGVRIAFRPGGVLLDGDDVSAAIRTPELSRGASIVSARPVVRAGLLELQRQLALAAPTGAVLEGRDIGTVVFPDADLKIFLTASDETRARRRYEELVARGEAVTFETVLAAQRQRDRDDSGRAIAPLRAADDAVVLDSSSLSLDQVVERIVALARERMASRSAAG
jgi:cytidylate kinase